MLVGVVSDTHNNVNNIENIIKIFNFEKVDVVVHTGDISKPKTLKMFSALNSPMIGVFGNNDREESGFEEVCKEFDFDIKEPPYLSLLSQKKVVIFHEPDQIQNYLKVHKDIDLVLHGHTHRYREELVGKALCFNPGESAGLIKGKNAVGIINLSDLKIRRIFF